MVNTQTIVAVATPPGRGGIAVVRISGPMTGEIARQIVGDIPAPRYARATVFRDADNSPLDHGIALYFPAPNSFTGEDVLELQGHGGAVVVDMVVQRVLELGARMARPGEYTERAFLNNKIDLTQAEAVADLIDSSSRQAARSALRSLDGVFSKRIRELTSSLVSLRTFVEAAIDFPEEEVDFLTDGRITQRLQELQSAVGAVRASAHRGCLLREGLRVVIVGAPNVGKSSLLNALLQADRAIVSDVPGTTRDTIEQEVQLDGLSLWLVDTAGIRDVDDQVEHEGVRRAHAAMAQADHALLLVDDTTPAVELERIGAVLPSGLSYTLIFNKIDLSGRAPGSATFSGAPAMAVSATTGLGLAQLCRHLKQVAGHQDHGDSVFIARRRHLTEIDLASSHIRRGVEQLCDRGAGELLAEELRLAHNALSRITGEFTSEDLLTEIFSGFCIGK